MDYLTLATASLNQTPLDWKGNKERILRALTSLAQPGKNLSGRPDIAVFPELVITGYGCEDAFQSPDVINRALENFLDIARESQKILPFSVIILGLPVHVNDQIYNAAAVLYNGKTRGIVPKSHLAGDGVHYEPRWFTPFKNNFEKNTIKLNGEDVPFGQLIFDINEIRFFIEICEDAWVPQRPALAAAEAGLDLILNPSASHFAFNKNQIRKNIAIESSRSFCSIFAMVNLLGCEAGRIIYDGGSIVASNGSLLLDTPRFSFRESVISEINIELEANRVFRSRPGSFKKNRPNDSVKFKENVVKIIGEKKEPSALKNTINLPPPASGNSTRMAKEEEFLAAVTLGLFDYFRKSKARGFTISLSGGADSTTCLILVQRMILFSFMELGSEEALIRLNLTEILKEMQEEFGESADESRLSEKVAFVSKRILHTIYQYTENSSKATSESATKIASALNVHHSEVDIQDFVKGYEERIATILTRKLTWEADDLTLQNVQARSRVPLAWLLANATNSLLLTTSNRSEAAVGYCTMDGDTAGGLAPIAGVDKAFILSWLKWMETNGDIRGGPIPALSLVNSLEPTAELRPPEQKQTDETDLMPYELLDRIERLAIRDRKSPLEIYRILKHSNGLYESSFVKQAVKQFFILWSRNQWKRERYAPSFHLDDESLDPRTWYRFPILSGGYAEELKTLDSYVDDGNSQP